MSIAGQSGSQVGNVTIMKGQPDEIRKLNISQLVNFKDHPFHVENNTELFALMQSIEKDGLLVPLLARPNPHGEGYELISGHRRKAACEWAGVTEVPVIIRNLNDCEAVIAMVDSNLQREHLKPSEKAFAYRMKLEAMKQQGRRTDLTSSQVGTKFTDETNEDEKPIVRSDELIAKQIGESRNQIARYIRLTYLIPKILDMVDEGKIAFSVGVELSYLKEEEQYEVYAVINLEQFTPSLSQANRLKRMSQHGNLDMDQIYSILGEIKSNQREQLKIPSERLNPYFPPGYTEREKIELIEKLVKKWHDRRYAQSFTNGGR